MNPFEQPRDPLSVLDAIEGFYLAHILNHLHRSGLAGELSSGATAQDLAERHGYDPHLLRALLEYAVQRSSLLTRDGDVFRIAPTLDYFFGFQLDKFIGGYGPAIARLEHSLGAPDLGCSLVDRTVESEAYDRIGSPPNPVVLAIMSQLDGATVLDLGCGPGTTLAELASRDSRFRGWGVDVVASMCDVARDRIDRLGFSDRIEIVRDDARNLAQTLAPTVREQVDVIHCKGLMNELFGDGPRGAVAYLVELTELFPGRLLLNVDYYGKLGHIDPVASQHRHTLVHDVIQALTGQGVPPPDKAGWNEVYTKAGCDLEHVFQGSESGIDWCVHVVRLGDPQNRGDRP